MPLFKVYTFAKLQKMYLNAYLSVVHKCKKYKLFLIAFKYATDFSVGSNIVFVNAKSNFRKSKHCIQVDECTYCKNELLV